MKTRNSVIEVINRLIDVTGVDSERALSVHFGHSPTMLASKRQRGNVPYKEAVQLAEERAVSLDWLLLGRGPKHYIDNAKSYSQIDDRDGPAHTRAVADEQPPLPVDSIRAIVIGVEAALADTGRRMTPENKADLIATLVEMYAVAHAAPSRGQILKLVRSAS